MKVAVVIPARLGSTRLDRKVLADIGGRPMIQWAWEAARGAPSVDSVWIATDSAEVADAVNGFGGQVVMTSTHHATGTDRVAEAAESIDAEVVVNLQGDEPQLGSAILEALVRGFLADDVPMGTLVTRITDPGDATNPARVKVVARHDGRALYFSRAGIPFQRDDDGPGDGLRHIGVYIYTKDFLRTFSRLPPGQLEAAEKLEQLRALEHGYEIGLVEVSYDGVGVDTPEDLELVRVAAARSTTSVTALRSGRIDST